MRLISVIAVMFLALAGGTQASAHAFDPGYLELRSAGSERWRAFWRAPPVSEDPMTISVALPTNCDEKTSPQPAYDGSAWVAEWIAYCPGGLADGTIAIRGLEVLDNDVLVRYELSEGAAESRRLTPDQPSFVVPADPGVLDVLGSYFFLGVDHILEGIDHLLFVFALLLLISDPWRLLGAITAFTVAHSITMAAATLGWFSLPGPPVEAAIALSIIFLASELVQRDGSGTRLSESFPWIVSFTFGLLHGFGFAGALLDIGLPRGDLPLALLAFNLGVEAGQILFIAAVLAVTFLLGRIAPATLRTARRPGSPVSVGNAYLIGGVSAFWFIDRVAGF